MPAPSHPEKLCGHQTPLVSTWRKHKHSHPTHSPSHHPALHLSLYKYASRSHYSLLCYTTPPPSSSTCPTPTASLTSLAAMKARARRQRIPAFGEWNYDYGGDWPVTQYFDSAMQAGLVMAVPPSPKPIKKVVKWSDSATLENEKQRQHKVAVGLGEHGAVKKQGKQSRVADAGPHAAEDYNGYKACRVVKAVDQDLYDIPPDMLCHKPRKRVTTRSMWLGCLGLSCVA